MQNFAVDMLIKQVERSTFETVFLFEFDHPTCSIFINFSAFPCISAIISHSNAWKRPFDNKQTTDIDAAILTDHMMLQATELGLGTVWVCFFKPDIIKQEFSLPDHLEPVNILAIGYGNDAPAE